MKPVWARNASMRAGRYWMRLSRFFMIAASGELVHVADAEVAQAVLHDRPGSLGRIQLRGYAGSRTSVSQPG